MSLLAERDLRGQSKGYWWEEREFTHPETKNRVTFKSLPLPEQKRLNDMVKSNSPEKFKPEPSAPPVKDDKVQPQKEQPQKVKKVQPKEKVQPKKKPVKNLTQVKKIPEKMSKDEWFDYKFGKFPKKVQKQIMDGEKGFASIE